MNFNNERFELDGNQFSIEVNNKKVILRHWNINTHIVKPIIEFRIDDKTYWFYTDDYCNGKGITWGPTKLVTFETVPSTTQVPCHVAPRKGLESGWIQNLKDFEFVFQSKGHQITTIDEYLGTLNSHLKEPVSEQKPNIYSKMVQYYRRGNTPLQQS